MLKKIKMSVWFVLSALCLVGAGYGIDTNAGLGLVGLCTFAAIIFSYPGIKILEDIVFTDMPDEFLHHLYLNTGYLVHTKTTTSASRETILDLTDLATQERYTANLEGAYPPEGFTEVHLCGNDFLLPRGIGVVPTFALKKMEGGEADYTDITYADTVL